jgi:hypothetical protein
MQQSNLTKYKCQVPHVYLHGPLSAAYVGYNHTLRGGRIKYREYIRWVRPVGGEGAARQVV